MCSIGVQFNGRDDLFVLQLLLFLLVFVVDLLSEGELIDQIDEVVLLYELFSVSLEDFQIYDIKLVIFIIIKN